MAPVDSTLCYRHSIWERELVDNDLDPPKVVDTQPGPIKGDHLQEDEKRESRPSSKRWEWGGGMGRGEAVGGMAGMSNSAAGGSGAMNVGRRVSDYLKLMIPSSMTSFLSYTFTSTSAVSRLARKPSQTTKRTTAHRFVLQTAEFYGADFSAPPAEDPEIAALTTNALDDVQLQEQEQTRVAQGSVFISALTRLANSRSRLDGDHDEDDEEAPVDGEVSTQEQVPPQPTIASLGGLASLSMPPAPLTPAKKWTDAIREAVPAIDYSDVFPADIGHRAGVTVFRIEALKPVLLPPSRTGQFCIADCYIVLHSTTRHDAPSANNHKSSYTHSDEYDDDDTMMTHRIYVYIGTKAEIDKRFCAAMFSTGLRNWIYATRNVERETTGDESAEFLALFGGKFIVDENLEAATDSSLFVAEEKRWPLRLYMLCGNKEIKLRLVNPNARSLKSTNVFLLDWGRELYQWNGSLSTLQQKVKCRILTARINRHERVGKADVVELDEGDETARFWAILGAECGLRHQPRPRDDDHDSHHDDEDGEESDDLEQEDILAEKAAAEAQQAEDELFAAIGDAPVTLYRAFEDLSEDVGTHVVKVGKLARAMLVSDAAYVVDAGVELFLWIGKNASLELRGMATELLARVAPLQKRPKWVGLHKLMDEHESEVFKLRFPDWDTTAHEVNWEEVKSPNQMDGLSPRTAAVAASTGIRVDVRALYAAAAPHDVTTSAGVEGTLQHANGLLQQFSAFVYTKGRFVQLPEVERGHFFTDDAYVFLCVYRLEEERERARRVEKELKRRRTRGGSSSVTSQQQQHQQDDHPSSASSSERGDNDDGGDDNGGGDERGLECVVYFWQGRLASRLAYSTFKFKTQGEMEQLVRHMYGCDVRVAFLEQGKEPVALLAHMGNAVVMHRGKRADWLVARAKKDKQQHGPPRMYHIQTDVRYKTTRAVQVPLQHSSLVSRDCFYIHVPDGHNNDSTLISAENGATPTTSSYLWRGKGASKDEYRKAESMVGKILIVAGTGAEVTLPNTPSADDHLTLTTHVPAIQGAEPPGLLALLLPDHYPPASTPQTSQPPSTQQQLRRHRRAALARPRIHTGTEYYYVPPPRFLRCSCASGYFAVEEVVHWAQVDLHTDSCVILDPGAPRALWVWVGQGASDVVRKLCRKSVEVWLQRLDDGRGVGESVPSVFGGGAGGATSGGASGGWGKTAGSLQGSASVAASEENLVSVGSGPGGITHQPRARAETAARRAVMAGFKARKRLSGLPAEAQSQDPSLPTSPHHDDTSTTTTHFTTTHDDGDHSNDHHMDHHDPAYPKEEQPTDTQENDSEDVLWILQGREPPAFTAYFTGWDERPGRGCVDVGNAFTAKVADGKRIKKAAAAAAVAHGGQ
ncbi:hypothetical protein PhCBS80983_g03422 [Powellomyces hirtus]|uniref:Gelsolin-like domain-containing protein n=1 Tax=Powellomyces hirtus TaxID=109895 RepID=A0A507E2G2_9FUNG|nr:hypothetical protein PhCBS80983_g03422 [Powellomyces hirtus]